MLVRCQLSIVNRDAVFVFFPEISDASPSDSADVDGNFPLKELRGNGIIASGSDDDRRTCSHVKSRRK